MMREQRVVGGMVDRVGQSGDGEHRDQKPVGRHQANEREGDRFSISPNKHRVGADAVGQKAGRRLEYRRRRH